MASPSPRPASRRPDRADPLTPEPAAPASAPGQSAFDALSDPLREAAETMRAVRERCVWSARITHDDLVPYLIEESAELIDAVETGSRAELREELGDLLWQVLFHSAVAAGDPDDPFDIDDVARGLTEKMVRRHPHVFGDAVARTPEEVLVHWNAAKAVEKSSRRSVFDGISPHMPSLSLAQKMLGRAGVPADAPVTPPVGPSSEEELGAALLGLVAVARERGWDAERALRSRLRRWDAEVRASEGSASGGGQAGAPDLEN